MASPLTGQQLHLVSLRDQSLVPYYSWLIISTIIIGNGVSSCTKLFADDCALYCEVFNIEDAESLQRDLRTVSLWSNQWQLRFNAAKCKAGDAN